MTPTGVVFLCLFVELCDIMYERGGKTMVFDTVNVAINKNIHKALRTYTKERGLLVGKFVEIAVLEKIERDKGGS